MSTHTDGAPPSVGPGPSVGAGPSARARPVGSAGAGDAPQAGAPPRPRQPSPSAGASDEDDTDAEAASPDATPPPDGPAARRNGNGRSRRAADPGDGASGSGPGWLQQEIARRIAEKGVSDTGRHARPDTAAGETTPPASASPARPATPAPPAADPPAADPPAADPPAAAEPVPTGLRPEAPTGAVDDPADRDDEDDDTRAPRAVPDRPRSARPRSGWMPDPYAPGGLRGPRAGEGWPPADDGTGPEPAFRLAGPAARPRPSTTPPDGPAASPETATPGAAGSDGPRTGAADVPAAHPSAPEDRPAPTAPPSADGAKQWPPAAGASGLPRRVPGAGWSLDREALLGGAAGVDTETRPVPSTWVPAGRRTLAPGPDTPPSARPDPAGPPTTDPGALRPADLDEYDDEDDDEYDDEYDDEDDDDLGGPAVERTEIIWRAPGLDEEPEPASRDAVVTPTPGVTPSENPYTGVRPRRFAAAPTDPEPVEEAEAATDGPEGRRVRVVLSERRTIAQSVRPVVDVQDPGSVGTTLRNGLVTSQLFLAARVFGVALLGLGLLPALFAAFPSIGVISVAGLRVPWLLLGFGVYPFLFGLGWWYVNSAERVEQDFAEGVQDR